jgi:LuxR family maltose regulon positive regulatory protein
MKSSLLATKLHRPSLPIKRVRRPYLIQQLNEGLNSNRPLTLVSAPAGFGKTTCISEWVNTLTGWSITWLSLDPSDDDPGSFFAYFIAVLKNAGITPSREIEDALHSGTLPPYELFSTTLINSLMEAENRCLLVLDDLHTIQDRFILNVLQKLVSNMPRWIHLVLITREDPPIPLARLRAYNRLTEIRAQSLRFSCSEAGFFLNEIMDLSLSQADITKLEEKTEGWIAGLQLAALAMQSTDSEGARINTSAFVTTLRGSHRFIVGYLAEQVVNRQTNDIQQFLLQTSILDKMNGDICDAVTGRSDSRALLEKLFNDNLFLVHLDEEQRWYRYHHLFKDLLLDLLSVRGKDSTAELHKRASRWYAHKGLIREAIEHALEGEDYPVVVDLLEQHAMQMIMRGYVKTVYAWVEAIPDELLSKNPKTNMAFAWMHLLSGANEKTAFYMDRLKEVLSVSRTESRSTEENNELRAEWLVMQSLMFFKQGKVPETIEAAEKALKMSAKQNYRVQSLANYALGTGYRSKGDYFNAIDVFQQGISHGRKADNRVAEMMNTIGKAMLVYEYCRLHEALETVEQIRCRIEQQGPMSPISAGVYGVIAAVYYQWYRIEEAKQNIQRAIHLSILGGYNMVTFSYRILFSRVLLMEGNIDAAIKEIQEVIDLLPIDGPDYIKQEAVTQQVCVSLASGRVETAETALHSQGFSFRGQFGFPHFPIDKNISDSFWRLCNSSFRVLLYRSRIRGDSSGIKQGIELADRLVTVTELHMSRYLSIALETFLLRAQMYQVFEESDTNPEAADNDYIRALELGEPEEFITVFLEQGLPVAEAITELAKHNRLKTVSPKYLERLLTSFGKLSVPDTTSNAQPASGISMEKGPSPLVDPLSNRELDVLRLMAEGMTYKEIAPALFISLNTVRFHIKSIYGKLGVNNRTHAVTKAQQFKLL